MRVLGIETSCDETAVAIYDHHEGLLAHEIYSQVAMHAEYGGVVPELASRDHVRKVVPLVRDVIAAANMSPQQIDGIAFTAGPGLLGALLVGASVAKSLAWAWDKPALGIHHLEGHLLAPMLEDDAPDFPFLALLVSGGHTQLIAVRGLGDYEILGESLDDAAGEAFDKTAKLLGLPYPGGPAVAKLAEQSTGASFKLPRPMTDRPGLDFSFSGLKTAVRNQAEMMAKQSAQGVLTTEVKAEICHAFQTAVVDTLAIKCRRALTQTGYKRLVIAGGVSANLALRQRLSELASSFQCQLFYPRIEFCTDNAAMIAYAGCQRFLLKQADNHLGIQVRSRWPLSDLS